MLGACTVQGHVHMLQGRPLAARAWLERGLPALDSLDAAAGETFVVDPKAMLLGLLSMQLLHLGLVEQARARMQQTFLGVTSRSTRPAGAGPGCSSHRGEAGRALVEPRGEFG